MHPALGKLLQDIVDAADKEERYINDLMIEFPMPPQNFLEGLEYGKAQNALYDLATALIWSAYNPYLTTTCWISKSATCIENYRTICEYWRIKSSRSDDIRKYYGDADLAFKLARNEAEGGIHVIIQTIVKNLKKERVDNSVGWLIPKVWNVWKGERIEIVREGEGSNEIKKEVTHKIPLHGSHDEHAAHVQSYKDRFSALLPAEYLEENSYYSAYNFDKVLADHHRLVRGVSNLL